MTNEMETGLKPFLEAVSGKKVMELVALDLRGLTSVADTFLILSGRSHRHVSAIAEYIRLELKKSDLKPLGVEGKKEGHWVILDYGDVVIHVFYDPVRKLYDLEGFWADAPRIETESLVEPETTG